MTDDFWAQRNKFMAKNEIHLISFREPGSNAFSCLCLGQGDRPEQWQIDKLKKLIADFEDGKYAPNKVDDDYSDLI